MIDIPPDELLWSFARSGGPGGQNVNKVASKAILRWDVLHTKALSDDVRQRLLSQQHHQVTKDGELIVTSQRTRDQETNRQDCLAKLAAMLEQASHVPKPRRPTRVTRASIERRLQGKQKRSGIKLARRQPWSWD